MELIMRITFSFTVLYMMVRNTQPDDVADTAGRHCGSLQEWQIQWTIYIIYCHHSETPSYLINCMTTNSILSPMPEQHVSKIRF